MYCVRVFKVASSYKRLGRKINRGEIEMRLRLERIKSKYAEEKKDVLIELLTTVHDEYEQVAVEKEPGIMDSFVKQVHFAFAFVLCLNFLFSFKVHH